ncbi:urea carboxylase [Desulfitobacterium sp. Sab5]|uniref:urea carboxylase n=1 Tax=Desulfitobacterium nosdiversum TaxID=3375356 RepID=UPI003CE894C8
MFTKVLIANRGAIACRIERTLRKMGIKSAAVYTKADQDSLHVIQADEAVLIGDGSAKESYLNAELILKTAISVGAQAIHPGYGFLSENPDFARSCAENGIVFIGPSPEQIEWFGLKHSARLTAAEAGVPLPQGTGLLQGLDEALAEAARIGYPVMLKSTAGGGGIGMRICEDEEKLRSAFESVKHLAQNNFQDDGVFLEKYIDEARHIEVQIFGNRRGEVIAVGERDCSVQRRNQKVMEECPAPNLPQDVRLQMHEAAVKLAKAAGYRSAGTVEFLYDTREQRFYFLEVNTRLQVEHGVTEEIYGIDLVEWMVLEAAEELDHLEAKVLRPQGHSIQARIYAEDCLNSFAPSSGRVDRAEFPEKARIETWIQDGSEVTTLYDPMLAKIIVSGEGRSSALKKLKDALDHTKIYGLTSNVQYLRVLLDREDYAEAKLNTHMLDAFQPEYPALEVLDGGIQTTVQDYPGRTGYWDVGVPPSGPMDTWSFRLGNTLLGNEKGLPGLEMMLKGGRFRFRGGTWFCLAGADMQARLDGQDVPMMQPVWARAGQVLELGEAECGMRTYLLIQGGIDVPYVLGSASTFTLGGFGGLNGRALRTGDVLALKPQIVQPEIKEVEEACLPQITNHWIIGVIPGPHCTVEFLQPDYLQQLISVDWEVHFNSSRTGVRLIGPTPDWTRQDGGEAGLHPSNIHDTAYALGALDMTGDMPILLGPDGPSLGGFVCPVTTASAELWKIGQLHPGDTVSFQLLTLEEGQQLRQRQEEMFAQIAQRNWSYEENADGWNFDGLKLPTQKHLLPPDYPILYQEEKNLPLPVKIRCAGDEYLLVEYGEMELDLKLRLRAHSLMQAIRDEQSIPYIDLTPGIRSLQVHIDSKKIKLQEACQKIMDLEKNLPPLESVKLPSRIVELPLSWNNPDAKLAMQRYQQNVRPDAPWCPDNIEFIRRVNGLDSIQDVYQILFNATYLVLGLGDVYLGAPVAVPLDPRHRLVTTKYNPARTWTPENAVGIGGAYLCIYGVEGPGGYQLVGRTVQMWNKLRPTPCFEEGKPWLLRFFDQIKFYPVEVEELEQQREDFLRGKFNVKITETTFDVGAYLAQLDQIKHEAAAFKDHQQSSFNAERERWKELGLAEYVSEQTVMPDDDDALPKGTERICAQIPGGIWKVLINEGENVQKDQPLVIMESMKMEFTQTAPFNAKVAKVVVKPGDVVNSGHVLLCLEAERSGD